MKKTRLYCDRCDAAQKETPAVTPVWIRVGGMPRTKREDVCTEHLQVITGGTGVGANGASAPTLGAAKPRTTLAQKTRWGPKSKVYQALYDRLLPYVAKTPVFTTDDLQKFFDGKAADSTLRPVLLRLIAEEHIRRPMQGFYVRPGVTIPEPQTVEGAADLALKLIRAAPGIRSAFVTAKAGITKHSQWKAARKLLREKGVRTKGSKSWMRMYPPKA